MIAAILLSLVSYFTPLLRDTNSQSATQRGKEQFAKQEYDAATASLEKAHEIKPTAESAFNLGTAQIASGKHALGSATLEPAMNDRRLATDALFNRGNSALAAGAFEHAIRDYTIALEMRPNDMRAKRNLEIALRRKQDQAQRPGAGGKQDQQGTAKNQEQKPSAGGRQQQDEPKGNADLEALLRSVQQQEQEERQRMKRAGQPRERVGW